MKILTIATENEGYLDLLVQTAEKFDYELKVMGWGMEWKGLAWKLELYISELEKIEGSEQVVCVEGYDTVVVGSSTEMRTKFLMMKSPVIFSGQRYFPRQKIIRSLADKLMSNNKKGEILKTEGLSDYNRPCTGLFTGYAGNLLLLFRELIKIEQVQKIGNDQILLNIYYLQNPDSIKIDDRCELFQNLWRTGSGLFGKFLLDDKNSDINVIFKGAQFRIENKYFRTEPCFLHAPFNLDISSVLEQLKLQPKKLSLRKGWNYSKYSLFYYAKRGMKFFWKEIVLAVLIIGFIVSIFMYIRVLRQ
jgi:hypothetical protein